MLDNGDLVIRLLQKHHLDHCVFWHRVLEAKGFKKKLKAFLLTCYLVYSAIGKEVEIPWIVNDVKEMDTKIPTTRGSDMGRDAKVKEPAGASGITEGEIALQERPSTISFRWS